jgi:hypothetical protein
MVEHTPLGIRRKSYQQVYIAVGSQFSCRRRAEYRQPLDFPPPAKISYLLVRYTQIYRYHFRYLI